MAIDPEEVRHIAGLARLRLSEEELPEVASTLDEILNHVGQLQEVDTAALQEGRSPLPRQPDTVRRRSSEDFLALSAGRSGRFVEVPTVVSTGTGHHEE